MNGFETQRLIDGEWRTVTVDVHHIMNSLQRQSELDAVAEDSKLLAGEKPAHFAVLSQTAFQSPLVKWILPARLRDNSRADIVIVGEDFIHLKEAEHNGHLRHIATKADFPARIRAAKIIGVPKPLQEVTIKPEGTQPSLQTPTTVPVQPGHQMLILTLANHEMMVFSAETLPDGLVSLKSRAFPLPALPNLLEQPGVSMAVDPYSRALAVGAWQNTIMLYSTKSTEEYSQDNSLDLFSSERALRVHGVILAIDFLYPAADDPTLVILVVVFVRNSKTRLTCFEWDTSIGVDSLHTRVDGQQLPKGEHKPLLMIPLQNSSDFMLVGKDDIFVYRNMLSGSAQSHRLAQKVFTHPPHRHKARQAPLCVNWARVPRIPTFRPEIFYLVREDGVVYYLDVNNGAARASKCAEFSCSVDTAFAILQESHQHPDYLIAAGSSSPGELLSIGDDIYEDERVRPLSRQRADVLSPKFIESIPNWSPCVDLEIPANSAHGNRVFTFGGKSPYGAISEIRWGVEARLVTIYDLDVQGLTGIWAFESLSGNGMHFLFSFPMQSILWHATDTVDNESEAGMDDFQIDMDNETVAAATLKNERVIQVSRQRIVTLSLPEYSAKHAIDFDPNSRLIAADIASTAPEDNNTTSTAIDSSRKTYILAAIRAGSDLEIAVFCYNEETDCVIKTTSTCPPSEPICVKLFSSTTTLFACISTVDGDLILYRINAEGCLSFALSHRISIPVADPAGPQHSIRSVCDSLVPVHLDSKIFLVCGLRDGFLCVFGLHTPQDSSLTVDEAILIRQLPEDTIKLSNTPVKVLQTGNTIIALCGASMHRLDVRDIGQKAISISKIWFTDRNKPDLDQTFVSAVLSATNDLRIVNNLSNPLVCVSQGKLLIAQMTDQPDVVTRSIKLLGTPYRAIYHEKLENMVVAATVDKIHRVQLNINSSAYKGDLSSIIAFVSMDEKKEESSEVLGLQESDIPDESNATDHIKGVHSLRPFERVNSISQWSLEDENGSIHNLVIAGTEIADKEATSKTGRILILSPQSAEVGHLNIKVAKSKDCDAPVYAVAEAWGNRIAYCCGTTLVVEKFQNLHKRLFKLASFDLFSPATQISIPKGDGDDIGDRINITTAEHSFFAFDIVRSPRDDTDSVDYALELRYTDAKRRISLNHLSLEVPKKYYAGKGESQQTGLINLISDKSCSLAGLLGPRNPTRRSTARTLFEATLPKSIIRLRRGKIRPSWVRRLTDHNSSSGIIADDIIGLSSDGTLYSFTIVDEKNWSILKFLEFLIQLDKLQKEQSSIATRVQDERLRSIRLKMFAIEISSSSNDWLAQRVLSPVDYHINGDLFQDILRQGSLDEIVVGIHKMINDVGFEIMEKWNSLLDSIKENKILTTDARDEENGSNRMEISKAVIQRVRDIVQPVL